VSLECDTAWAGRRVRTLTRIEAVNVPKERFFERAGQGLICDIAATEVAVAFRRVLNTLRF
jgi:hypothetical protein